MVPEGPDNSRERHERDERGRWRKGVSGNPAGPGTGSRNRATKAAEALLDGDAERLTRKAVEMALDGDTTALRLCLERIAPPRKDAPVRFELPRIETAAEATQAMAAVVEAVAAGDLTPGEAQTVAGVVETYRKTLETAELEARVAALEAESGKAR